MRLLLVEDDPMIGASVQRGLRQEGHSVDWVRDGAAAELAIANAVHELILLDLGLPRKSGLELLASLRKKGLVLPVLVITARDSIVDRVKGLDAGADDYLVKPFSLAELLARMRVALRHRGTATRPATVRYERAGLAVDLEARRVHREGAEVRLTPTEYRLLARLVRQAGQVVTHRQLLLDVWGPEYVEHTHYLRLYMAQLRAKLEAVPADPRVLLTEPGVGYRLAEAGD
jgi:two-component system KDP operon response regulator KdpE